MSKPSSHEISLELNKGYVLVKLIGKHNAESIGEIVGKVRKATTDNGHIHALYDLSEVEMNLPVGNAYFFPRRMQNDYLHLPTNKIAVVQYQTRDPKFWLFYETTARNAGLDLKTFPSFEKAEEWLLTQAS
ncbi:MAG: hypothetical protein MRZ79_03055 [Bacteroidia bacterium]|nr:hypothetical protein [Bacteroidia bacterium]